MVLNVFSPDGCTKLVQLLDTLRLHMLQHELDPLLIFKPRLVLQQESQLLAFLDESKYRDIAKLQDPGRK